MLDSFDTAVSKVDSDPIEIELCLEHKVGRGWLSNNADKLRQALLIWAYIA